MNKIIICAIVLILATRINASESDSQMEKFYRYNDLVIMKDTDERSYQIVDAHTQKQLRRLGAPEAINTWSNNLCFNILADFFLLILIRLRKKNSVFLRHWLIQIWGV